jgi:hypothetical protein
MLSVADWAEIGFLELAGRAAEAIRELIHRTRVPGVFTGPAELYRLVAELAVLAGGLPQLLGQLDRWLHIDHDAGRVRSDDHADAGRAVRGAAADLAGAGATAHDLAGVLNNLLERCDGRKLETGPW